MNDFGKIKQLNIDTTWTLFLDRDGVINHEKKDDYIRHYAEFSFYEGAIDAIVQLSKLFGTVLIVTNQRGIGKGLMTEYDLATIHSNMLEEIGKAGGRIDKIYHAPELDSNANNRKPNTGMGLQAKADFPHIDFTKCMMVGNNISDMEFGKNLNMRTIYLETTKKLMENHPLVDLKLNSLFEFAEFLKF